MNNDSISMALHSPAQEADIAQPAVTDHAKAQNLAVVAEMADGTNDAYIAAHIRGVVAATMGQVSASASAITRTNAEQWQDWALGVADRVAQTAPAVM